MAKTKKQTPAKRITRFLARLNPTTPAKKILLFILMDVWIYNKEGEFSNSRYQWMRVGWIDMEYECRC